MPPPHTIEQSTLSAYGVRTCKNHHEANPLRRLKAEDIHWSEGLVPRLSQICLRSLPVTVISVLPSASKNFMMETLPTDIPLPLATRVIPDGVYWERRSKHRWSTGNNVQEANGSWKRLYLEKHSQEVVEALVPDCYAEEELENLCKIATETVRKIQLRQLQIQPRFLDPEVDEEELGEARERINLKILLSGLQNLAEFHVRFAVKNVGSNYRKILFDFTHQDCRHLGEGVGNSQKLRLLRIYQSKMDDSKLITLLSHMQNNVSLEAVEFPHCQIGDEGAAALSKFTSVMPNLRRLDISNNRIGYVGIQALSSVLTKQQGSGLIELKVGWNDFGDEGAQFLLSALQRQAPALRVLNISCTGLKENSGILLGEVFSRNKCLLEVDASNNALGSESGKAIKAGLKNNVTLQFLDLRMTGIMSADHIEIESLLHRNRCREQTNTAETFKFMDENNIEQSEGRKNYEI